MNKLVVNEITFEKDHYIAMVDKQLEKQLAKTIRDGGRMLVDSDQIMFIYVLEDDESLYYVCFEKGMWEFLKKVKEEERALFVQLHEEVTIELKTFCDELNFLVDNIKGNGNYGEKMENAVNQIFA